MRMKTIFSAPTTPNPTTPATWDNADLDEYGLDAPEATVAQPQPIVNDSRVVGVMFTHALQTIVPSASIPQVLAQCGATNIPSFPPVYEPPTLPQQIHILQQQQQYLQVLRCIPYGIGGMIPA